MNYYYYYQLVMLTGDPVFLTWVRLVQDRDKNTILKLLQQKKLLDTEVLRLFSK
jgi:hypothetical protein